MIKIISNSTEQTELIGQKFGEILNKNDVVAFCGGMGHGKTAFIRGCCRGMNYLGNVSSPTYSIVHEYVGDKKIYHFDMYRISSYDDLFSTGFFDYIDTDAVLLIEWSENILEDLPDETIYIEFKIISDNQREIILDSKNTVVDRINKIDWSDVN